MTVQDQQQQNIARLQKLESEERLRQLPPERLLDLLAISRQDQVLDLGAGGGYFTFEAARRTEGEVFAVDPDPFMLETLNARCLQYGTSHVRVVQGSAERIPLPDASVDAVIASLLLHMLQEPAAGLREMCRVLRQGGRGLIVEWKHPRPDGKPGHRVPLNEMQQLLLEQGATVIHENDWADTWYSLVFAKARG